MGRFDAKTWLSFMTGQTRSVGVALPSKWIHVKKCPACNGSSFIGWGKLLGNGYKFGHEVIPFPRQGIALYQCKNCGLVFKLHLPSQAYLSEVFTRQAGNVWQDDYHFKLERDLIIDLVGKKSFDLLDVGPSNGGLLDALKDIPGRRSGLDVVRHPGLSDHLRGEFMPHLIDDEHIEWSRNPYDVVTGFDVIEHLYKPKIALSNLKELVKDGGYVVIETGDSDSFYPKKFGGAKWWYVRLFEHHIFWNEPAIRKIADICGFSVVGIVRKKHKSRMGRFHLGYVKEVLKSCIYQCSPAGYYTLGKLLKKNANQPRNPFVKDHLQVVLRKVKNPPA